MLQIESSSAVPSLAARGAKEVADLFLNEKEEAKKNQATAARDLLSGKIAQLRAEVAEADAKVEAFRSDSGLLDLANGMTAPSQQLAEITQPRSLRARAAQSVAAAKAQLLREMLRAGRDVDDATPANARVIATAQQPLAPTFPEKAATVLLATLAGFLLAAGVVVARALPEAPGAETYAAPTMRPDAGRRPRGRDGPAPAMPTANAVPEAADEPPTEASMAPGDFDGNEDEREERVDPTTALEAIVDRLAESAETSDSLKVLVTGEATKGALAPGLTAARRLSKTGRAVLVDWASRSLGWATSSITEEPTRPLASPACSRAARASTRRCIAIFPRGSTFLPADERNRPRTTQVGARRSRAELRLRRDPCLQLALAGRRRCDRRGRRGDRLRARGASRPRS